MTHKALGNFAIWQPQTPLLCISVIEGNILDSEIKILSLVRAYMGEDPDQFLTWLDLRFLTPEELAPHKNPVEALRALAEKGLVIRARHDFCERYVLTEKGQALLEQNRK